MNGAHSSVMGKDAGFMLAAVIVLVFLVLLTLTIAAPKIAMGLKREREIEAQHRANQYVRAIRLYSLKFNHQYPGSIEQLQKSNNQRFLRQKYLDPLTGKDDWRLIHVGENKTKVKGFFGEDLPGLAGGLGSAAGLQSGPGTATTGSSSTSQFNNSGIGGASQGSSQAGGIGNGGTGTGATSGTGSTGSNAGTGTSSQSADSLTGTGGPIMGIGSSATGEAILTVNEQTNYQDWEFLYDPRIEQLYAKGNLLGGGITSGSPSGNGLGTTPINGTLPPPPGTTPTTPGPAPTQPPQ